MTNLSHLAPISNHFQNGNHVKKNAATLQKIETIKCANSKKILIAKIKELQLTESSMFSDRLFEDHKNKLIELVENETNLHSITCEHNDAGDLCFLLHMLKSQNLFINT